MNTSRLLAILAGPALVILALCAVAFLSGCAVAAVPADGSNLIFSGQGRRA